MSGEHIRNEYGSSRCTRKEARVEDREEGIIQLGGGHYEKNKDFVLESRGVSRHSAEDINIVVEHGLSLENTQSPVGVAIVKIACIESLLCSAVHEGQSSRIVKGKKERVWNNVAQPFWRVWNAVGSDGRGVIGVLEADFVEPAHDKQGFERPTSVPYAKPKPSVGESSDEDVVPPGITTSGCKIEVWPIRNSEASKLVEYAQYDATPEAYASTSRKVHSKLRLHLKY
ncbi:microrchidia 7-like protein [Tanacetum coccineum]